MAANHTFELDCKAPSTHDRIKALFEQGHLFEHTANHPHAGIYNRFGEEWTMVVAYVEGKVHGCSDAAKTFIWKKSGGVAEDSLQTEFPKVMGNLIDALLLHGMYSPCQCRLMIIF